MHIALVTGAASGIGRAVFERLQHDGLRVIGVDLVDGDVVADLATPAGRRFVVDQVAHLAEDGLDTVVACAGLSAFGQASGSRLVQVNFFGAAAVLDQLAARDLIRPDGSSVVIGSNSATTTPNVPVELVDACLAGDVDAACALAEQLGAPMSYAASKLALTRWARRRATTESWIGRGHRLNVVAPGLVDTPMTAAMAETEAGAAMLDRLPNPLGRAGRPDEIAALVSFLVSAESGLFVGSVVTADGGTEALLRADDLPSVRVPRRPPTRADDRS